jgi:hypothetical protein
MRIRLNVPFHEKDKAKELGARWDQNAKTWYLWDYAKIDEFSEWLDGDYCIYITEKLYLAKGIRECWHCGKGTPVYSVGATKTAYKDKEWKFYPRFYLVNNVSGYSKAFETVLRQTNGQFRISYSKTTGTSYLNNHCSGCGRMQGDNFLYEEIDAVFSPTEAKDAEGIRLMEFSLEFDIGMLGCMFFSINNGRSSNELIFKHAKRTT